MGHDANGRRERRAPGVRQCRQTTEAMRAASRWPWLDRAERNVRYAARALRRTPAFSLTVADVVALVMRQSLRMAAIGGAIGITLALGVSRLFASQLEIINTFDLVAYGGSVALALFACMAAAWMPPRQAARVDPLETLRQE